MRKLIMWNLVTLDGFFEGAEKWDLGWHEEVWGDELEQFSIDQTATADLLLFGRITYEGMAAHWRTATGAIADIMNRIPKIVFSRTLQGADWNNTRLVSSAAEEEVARLKEQQGKDILIFGSADLCASLRRQGLIDEYRIGLAPLLLGAGTALFRGGDRLKMELIESRQLRSGCVILFYRPAAA